MYLVWCFFNWYYDQTRLYSMSLNFKTTNYHHITKPDPFKTKTSAFPPFNLSNTVENIRLYNMIVFKAPLQTTFSLPCITTSIYLRNSIYASFQLSKFWWMIDPSSMTTDSFFSLTDNLFLSKTTNNFSSYEHQIFSAPFLYIFLAYNYQQRHINRVKSHTFISFLSIDRNAHLISEFQLYLHIRSLVLGHQCSSRLWIQSSGVLYMLRRSTHQYSGTLLLRYHILQSTAWYLLR